MLHRIFSRAIKCGGFETGECKTKQHKLCDTCRLIQILPHKFSHKVAFVNSLLECLEGRSHWGSDLTRQWRDWDFVVFRRKPRRCGQRWTLHSQLLPLRQLWKQRGRILVWMFRSSDSSMNEKEETERATEMPVCLWWQQGEHAILHRTQTCTNPFFQTTQDWHNGNGWASLLCFSTRTLQTQKPKIGKQSKIFL